MSQGPIPHTSVMPEEILQSLEILEPRLVIDGTAGAGGHSHLFLDQMEGLERLIAVDQDPQALDISRERLSPYGDKVQFVEENFSQAFLDLQEDYEGQVDGILLDLGVSSMQLDRAERGFSFMQDGPLDMRMSPSNPLSAEEIVKYWSLKELERIFRDYGELPKAKKIAETIIRGRRGRRLESTKDLVDFLLPVAPKNRKAHPMTLIFQALRIAVNDELGVLQLGLERALKLLRPGGRLAVLTFHSLEDRLVKLAFRDFVKDQKIGILVHKKPLQPTLEEIRSNRRSRSAKLRILEKIEAPSA